MSKYYYKFEFVGDKTRQRGKILAWKWGSWKYSPSWTSDKTVEADYSTENAANGLRKAGNVLMIAVHHANATPFTKDAAFGVLEIQTFENDNTSGTPLRTAAYHSALVIEKPIPRDFSALPHLGKRANYSEVLLKVEGVNVTP